MRNKFLFLILFLFTSQIHSQNFWQDIYTGNFYPSSLDVSSAKNVFAATDSFLIRSTNNGLSWQIIYTTPSWIPYCTFGASPTSVIYLSSDSVKKSTDEGNTWITTNQPYYGGVLWFLVTNNEGDIFTETGVLIGGYSFRSTDEGATWIQIGIEQAILNSISFHPNGYTYAVYGGLLPPGYSNLFKSSNKGDDWENIQTAPPMTMIVYVAKNGHIYVGNNNSLFKSIDEGLNWVFLLNAAVKDITENQLEHLFISTSTSGVFESTDYGATWQQINSGLEYLSATNLNVDSLGYLYVIAGPDVANQTKLYRSVDSTIPVELTSFTANVDNGNVELNWSTTTELNNSGFEVQRCVYDENFETIAFIAGFGTTTEPKHYSFTDNNVSGFLKYRLKQIDFDGIYEYSKIIEVQSLVNFSFELKQNYPNPFNPSTKIKYSVPQTLQVQIKVFDVLGTEIETLVNEQKPAGTYELTWYGANLPSGVYFYQLRAGAFIETKKMVLLK